MSGLEYWVSYYFGLVQFALPLFALGVVLLVVGLWGKHSGTEPRCKKCQYNLTGLTSDRCPECGTELSGRTIRTGLRYRRRKCAVMGLLACIATVSPVAVGAYRTAMQIDWYSYCPFSWMLQRAEGADWKAFRELRRRYDAKRLSQSQLHSLMETCLTIQAQGAALPLLRAGINLAYRMGLEGNTTAEQSKRFHSQLINPYIEVRPRIQQGSPLPFRLLERNGCPSALAIVTHFDEWPITVGGRLVSAGRERWGSSVTGAGRHLVRSEVTIR